MADLRLIAGISLAEAILWVASIPEKRIKVFGAGIIGLTSIFFIPFVVQYTLLKLYRVILYPRFFSPFRNIPGPKDDHPMIGQFAKINLAPTPSTKHLEWHEKWGPDLPFIRYRSLGNAEYLLVNSLEAHKEVLQTHCYSFKKPDLVFRFVGGFLGRGILFQEGAEHKRQRKILGETFVISNLRRIFPVFQYKSRALADLFGEYLDKSGKGVVDVVDAYNRLGLDVAGFGILGVELDNLKSSDPKYNFISSYRTVLMPSPLGALITAIDTLVPIRKLLPIEANLSYIRAPRTIREMITQVVHDRITEVERGEFTNNKDALKGRDVLTMVAQHRQNTKDLRNDEFISEGGIVDHILNFFGAGFETVSSMSAWSSYVMATRQDIEDKLRTEVLDLLAKHRGEAPTWEAIDKLPYLNNYCKEVLRVHSPVIITYREAIRDLTICNVFVPKGTSLFINPAVTNRSKFIWGPDADEFIPERWDKIQENPDDPANSPYAFNSFLNGPRICIGKTFAMMEFKAMVVEVLSKFRFVTTPELEKLGGNWPPVENPAVTLRPRGVLRVGVERL
ncbi:cytochrome P450 [Naviculisporaceae sp. PSN 640]